ncbi:MAG: hypothetical protein ABFS37_05010 [Acidobacteriota bacterium]
MSALGAEMLEETRDLMARESSGRDILMQVALFGTLADPAENRIKSLQDRRAVTGLNTQAEIREDFFEKCDRTLLGVTFPHFSPPPELNFQDNVVDRA